MKTLILYCSKHGSTKAYAEDLAKRVSADIYPIGKLKPRHWADYDTIVFGGWVMGGKIQGVDKFLAEWDSISDKNVIIFAVGMGLPDKTTRANLISQNILDLYHLRFYQLRGSFDFAKLKFPYNILLKSSIGQMRKDPAQSDTISALDYFREHPLECYDTEKIERIESVIESIASEAPSKE